MANHEPRRQRLAHSRKARSQAREHHAKQHSLDLDNTKPDKEQWLLAKRLNVIDEEFIARYGEDPYKKRQQERQVQHLKRNKRKNNRATRPLLPVYSPEELKLRNVLLSLNERPTAMPVGLYRRLRKERKELLRANPPLRGIPDYSPKAPPRPTKPKRFQEAYELDSEVISEAKLKELVAKGARQSEYHYVDSPAGTGNLMISGYRRILGVKRIPHY